MWQIFKIFWRTEGTRPLLVLTCLLLGGFAEAIGIGAMLPLLSTVLNEGTSAPSLIDKVTYQLLATLGLQPSLGILLVLILVIMTFRSIVLFATMTFAGVTGARVTINLRRKLVRALFDARWSFYARQSSGRIANSLGNDAQNAGNAYTLSATAATLFVQILAYAAVALAINWRVALCGLAAGLMIAAVSKRFVSLSRKAGYKQTDRVAVFASDTTGMLQNIKALKAMNRFESPIDNLAILLKKLKRTLYTQSVAKFALIYGNDLMIAIFVCVGTWLAINFLKVPAAQLLVFGLLFFQVISYVTKFLKQLQSASLAEAGYTRTQQLIDETVAAEEVNTGSISPATGQGCRFEHVSFAHEDMPVVKDAHFNIPANKITVLEGPSGSGKTTLVDLLIGFHRADQGMIYVGENPIADIDIKQWRNKIGYVPQDLMLFHDNVRNNVTLYDTNITDEEIRNAADLAGVSGFLSALPSGLDTDVGELGGRLSGGQRQRIALARALVRKPELLILDEVTSALDPETESAIVDNISRLRGQFTIIVITHRPAWTNIADNLLKVEHGTVKQSKPTKRQKKS